MDIKVLGTGCANCKTTTALIEQVARDKGVAVNIDKIQDMQAIIAYGVLATPGVVVDGKVVLTGAANWSEAAEESNHEDVLALYSSELAAEYLAHFDEIQADDSRACHGEQTCVLTHQWLSRRLARQTCAAPAPEEHLLRDDLMLPLLLLDDVPTAEQ